MGRLKGIYWKVMGTFLGDILWIHVDRRNDTTPGS